MVDKQQQQQVVLVCTCRGPAGTLAFCAGATAPGGMLQHAYSRPQLYFTEDVAEDNVEKPAC